MKASLRIMIPVIVMCIGATAFRENNSITPDGNFRIFGNKRYQVMDSVGFYLYERYEPTEIIKGKNLNMQHKYFFSRNSNSDVEPLTLANLENVFSENDRFRYLLESEFRNDRELIAFDRYLHIYKIEYLYKLSYR